ncbi:MAG: Crp/Fnr family transcriptional regulator [Cyclobacteriaceae bacterium]|nr:Crp/Fnr family transcriptional regulator [Cyclobacteriaceae bacterium]
MDTNSIISSITRHVNLDPAEEMYFKSLLLPIKVRQGDFPERAHEISKGMLYVNSGCLMSYFTDKQGTDRVIQFATAGWWTGDLHSFTKQIPSIYTTKALADSEVFLLPKTDMDAALERLPKLERYFRMLFQNSLVAHQHRLVLAFSATAEERYQEFEQKYSSLEQYVPLKYIASYLGITPEFLSKIRRRRMEK